MYIKYVAVFATHPFILFVVRPIAAMSSSASSTPPPLCGLDMLRIASEALASGSQSPPSPPTLPAKAPKKRGRKPTPGMSEEDRKRARLMKNRRTAEMSRRRKVAYLETLRNERDDAVAECERLRADNARLRARLAEKPPVTDGAA